MWSHNEKSAVWSLEKDLEPDHAGTLILDFQTPELWKINFYCSQAITSAVFCFSNPNGVGSLLGYAPISNARQTIPSLDLVTVPNPAVEGCKPMLILLSRHLCKAWFLHRQFKDDGIFHFKCKLVIKSVWSWAERRLRTSTTVEKGVSKSPFLETLLLQRLQQSPQKGWALSQPVSRRSSRWTTYKGIKHHEHAFLQWHSGAGYPTKDQASRLRSHCPWHLSSPTSCSFGISSCHFPGSINETWILQLRDLRSYMMPQNSQHLLSNFKKSIGVREPPDSPPRGLLSSSSLGRPRARLTSHAPICNLDLIPLHCSWQFHA